MPEVIIKVGGSLQKGNNLADLCLTLGNIGKKHRIIIIPGGGIFADSVKKCTQDLNIDQDTAHWMAILAMNQYGYLLSSLISGSVCTENISELKECADKHQPVVFLPYRLIKEEDPLPHSWNVTSDSIAAWIAGYIKSRKLVLIKSRDMPNNNSACLNPLPLDFLKNTDMVDSALYPIVKKLKLDLWIINSNCPEQLIELFRQGNISESRLS